MHMRLRIPQADRCACRSELLAQDGRIVELVPEDLSKPAGCISVVALDGPQSEGLLLHAPAHYLYGLTGRELEIARLLSRTYWLREGYTEDLEELRRLPAAPDVCERSAPQGSEAPLPATGERCPGCASDDCAACRAEATRNVADGARQIAAALVRQADRAAIALEEMARQALATDAALDAPAAPSVGLGALQQIRRIAQGVHYQSEEMRLIFDIADNAVEGSRK